MGLTSVVLPAGQYGWLHDIRQVADGTPSGVVTLARQANLRGILAKYNDGHSTSNPDGEQWQAQCRALAKACASAGLLLIPWGYVYPQDTDAAFGAVVAQAVADTAPANPQNFYILDAEIEFDNDPNAAADAQAMIAAAKSGAPIVRLLYTSWGWPDQHPNFPWTTFQDGCEAFLPQIYPGTLQAGVDMGTYWNRAYGGPQYGGPNPGHGPAGYNALQPQKPVIPTFDFGGDSALLARLANNGGFPAITWWVMDGMSQTMAQVLAATPYAKFGPQPAPAPTPQPSPSPAPVPSPQPVPSPSPTATKLVVIDPGHGGNDTGAQGINGKYEKDSNLRCAVYLAYALTTLGYKVILTRTADTDLGGTPYSLDADLTARANLANNNKADLFISLHADTGIFPLHGVHCIQSIDPSRTLGDFAKRLVATVCGLTGQTPASYGDGGVWSRPGNPTNVDYYAVIRLTTMPAFILERGFVSNPDECNLLFDDAFLKKQAQAIATAIAAYLN